MSGGYSSFRGKGITLTSLYLHHLEGESWNLVLKIELPIVNKFSPADVFAKVVECARKRRLGHLENS